MDHLKCQRFCFGMHNVNSLFLFMYFADVSIDFTESSCCNMFCFKFVYVGNVLTCIFVVEDTYASNFYLRRS